MKAIPPSVKILISTEEECLVYVLQIESNVGHFDSAVSNAKFDATGLVASSSLCLTHE